MGDTQNCGTKLLVCLLVVGLMRLCCCLDGCDEGAVAVVGSQRRSEEHHERLIQVTWTPTLFFTDLVDQMPTIPSEFSQVDVLALPVTKLSEIAVSVMYQ